MLLEGTNAACFAEMEQFKAVCLPNKRILLLPLSPCTQFKVMF